MAQVEGVVDLSTEMQTEIPTLRVKVEPELAARHGVPTGVVTEALQTARVGRAVGQVLEGRSPFRSWSAMRATSRATSMRSAPR